MIGSLGGQGVHDWLAGQAAMQDSLSLGGQIVQELRIATSVTTETQMECRVMLVRALLFVVGLFILIQLSFS
jgi:hypothetical protein